MVKKMKKRGKLKVKEMKRRKWRKAWIVYHSFFDSLYLRGKKY